MHELGANTILNGKYIIEASIISKEDVIIYKATDLILREEVFIHEFCPGNVVARSTDSDEIILKNITQQQYFEKLSEFENGIVEKVQKQKDTIVKNYFRENNTGYLVVVENKKTVRKNRLVMSVVLGVLALIIASELGLLLFKKMQNDNGNAVIKDEGKENIELLLNEEEEIISEDGDTAVLADEKNVELTENKKQYSQEELLEMIHKESGYELFGTPGKNDISCDWRENIYGKRGYEFYTDEFEGYKMKFIVAPSLGYDAYIYDDFDGDGEKELFALMRNIDKDYDIRLWFSNGADTYEVEKTKEYDYSDWDHSDFNSYISCKGLKSIQYGNTKHLVVDYGLDFNEPGGRYEDIGADIYCIDNGIVTNISDLQSGIDVEEGVDGNIVIYNMQDNKDFGEFAATYEYKIIRYNGNREAYKNIDLNNLSKTDIYYLNGKYNEYLAHKASEDELSSITNYDESINELKEVIKDLYFSPVKQTYGVGDGSEPYDMSVDSIYISDNDKIYVNCIMYCYSDGWKDIGRDEWDMMSISENTVYANAVFSLSNGKMQFLTMYPGFRKETSGVFK